MENTSFLLVISLFLSVAFPYYSSFLERYLTFLLIIMMVFSLKNVNIKLKDLKNFYFKRNLKKIIILIFINYILLPFVIILSAFFFVKDVDFRNGFIIMASVPCAIIVITFTKLLKEDVLLSTFGLYFNYFVSLFMTPLIIWLFFKETISVIPILKTIFLLVILPLVLANFLDKVDKKIIKGMILKYDKIIINIIFVITTYAFIGLNIKNIVNIFYLKEIVYVLIIKTFFLSFVFLFFTKDLVYAIFANYKNLGYAIILSLSLFNKETALPSVIGIFFDNILFIFLNTYRKSII
ncbi:MAG: hypothetical protein QW757_03170 [Candidatus Woesearchaeota archaeon]